MTQAVLGIDPRIRARRIAVRRAEGRRRLRFLLGAFGVVVVCIGAWALTRTPLLDLDHVRVEGITGGSYAEVEQAAGLVVGAPLFDVDTAAVASRVEALPWVESAAVRRDWPGTIRIDVVERVPVALLPAGEGGYATVDAAGVVVGVGPAAAPALPLVAVDLSVEPGEIERAAVPGLAVVDALTPDLVPWVERVVVDGDGPELVVRLDLTGRAVADLGPPALLADKVRSLRAVLAGVDLACIARIDVTVADLATVTRGPGAGPGCEVTASDG